ncbi:polymorphic toxin type 50 domain-containing protein [Bacillus kwashiorkori]|uniref:polymorphic toxin type 50 domain-containing protein n=1 Tax=Bacillus kwashiorkori TaxID=1522318 RepID=UPI003B8381F4
MEGRSYLTISPEEVQDLVNLHAGTGKIRLTGKGNWDKKEIIEVEEIIGVSVDNLTGEGFKTNMFKIHYSKKGVHIVPFRKG